MLLAGIAREAERQIRYKMADLYLKALDSERKSLWATCRLKGLAKGSPERLRIAQIDEQLSEHKARKGTHAP